MQKLKEKEENNTILTQDNLTPIITTELPIRVLCCSYKNILVAVEKEILVYNINNIKLVNTFKQHKGLITNVILINKPISQYGLNVNNKLETTVLKSFKKPSANKSNLITISNSKKENFTNKLINDEINSFLFNKDYVN